MTEHTHGAVRLAVVLAPSHSGLVSQSVARLWTHSRREFHVHPLRHVLDNAERFEFRALLQAPLAHDARAVVLAGAVHRERRVGNDGKYSYNARVVQFSSAGIGNDGNELQTRECVWSRLQLAGFGTLSRRRHRIERRHRQRFETRVQLRLLILLLLVRPYPDEVDRVHPQGAGVVVRRQQQSLACRCQSQRDRRENSPSRGANVA